MVNHGIGYDTVVMPARPTPLTSDDDLDDTPKTPRSPSVTPLWPIVAQQPSGPQPARPGRPRDPALTDRLLTAAADLLAEDGWAALNADRLAERTRSGKAGTYRRWPNRTALAVAVIAHLRLLDPLPEGGTLTGDLITFHQPLTRPRTRDALAVVGLLGVVHQHPELAAAVNTALWEPLANSVRILVERHADTRAGIVSNTPGQHLVLLSTSLWARHLLLATPLTAGELSALLDIDHLG